MGQEQTAIQLNEVFEPLYTSPNRYFFITGGRGSLKSTTVHDFVARLTYERGHGILFTRYTMDSAEKSVIPEFRMTLARLGVEGDFHITHNIVRNLKTGSFILFSGLRSNGKDQTATLKSIAGITTWIIEEGEDFKDEAAFDKIDDSIRTASIQNRVIWIQNPTTIEHFIHSRWIAPKSKIIEIEGYAITLSDLPEVCHIHSTYHIAEELGFLSGDWLAKAHKAKEKADADHELWIKTKGSNGKHKNRSWYYHNYIGGWLDKAEGVIFENWEIGEFDEFLPYCYGLDLGFFPDPLGMVMVAVDQKKKRIYVKEELYDTKLSTEQAVEAIKNRVKKKNDLIVSDTNEPRFVNGLHQKGFNVRNAVKEKIIDDIREMQDYTIIVNPGSMNYIKELNNYAWHDKKANIPVDDYNHLIDPTRYGFRWFVGKPKSGVKYR